MHYFSRRVHRHLFRNGVGDHAIQMDDTGRNARAVATPVSLYHRTPAGFRQSWPLIAIACSPAFSQTLLTV